MIARSKRNRAKYGKDNPFFGKHHSEKSKQKMSETMKGKYSGSNHPLFGKHQSEEHRRNESESHKGLTPWNKGKHHSEKSKQKMSNSHKGKILSKEHRQKIGKSLKGHVSWSRGKHHSEETKRKISEKNKLIIGDKTSQWRGGISFEPYSTEWTNTLKRSIRERDNYVCRLCGKLQTDTAFDVHHIDYDKKNCNPNNLITLCRKHHIKTNNNRKYWIRLWECKDGKYTQEGSKS